MELINVGKENSKNIYLHYEDHGTGKPVVLIHGWPLNRASWEKQESFLLDEGYRVISYDRRGFGQSSQPSTGYDYDTFAADLDKLMNTLDLQDAILVGFSMGTGEVTRYISKYGSKRVDKAVLISSIPPYILKTSDNPKGVDQSVFDGIMNGIKEDRLSFLSQFFSDFYNLDENEDKLISKQAVQYSWNVASRASPIGTLACVKSWLTDFKEDVKNIDVPTLIIHGDADRVLPIDASGRCLPEVIKDNKYVEVKNGPHCIIQTHTEQVNNALIDFIS
jgi:non-heme chloroperoxidase